MKVRPGERHLVSDVHDIEFNKEVENSRFYYEARITMYESAQTPQQYYRNVKLIHSLCSRLRKCLREFSLLEDFVAVHNISELSGDDALAVHQRLYKDLNTYKKTMGVILKSKNQGKGRTRKAGDRPDLALACELAKKYKKITGHTASPDPDSYFHSKLATALQSFNPKKDRSVKRNHSGLIRLAIRSNDEMEEFMKKLYG